MYDTLTKYLDMEDSVFFEELKISFFDWSMRPSFYFCAPFIVNAFPKLVNKY